MRLRKNFLLQTLKLSQSAPGAKCLNASGSLHLNAQISQLKQRFPESRMSHGCKSSKPAVMKLIYFFFGCRTCKCASTAWQIGFEKAGITYLRQWFADVILPGLKIFLVLTDLCSHHGLCLTIPTSSFTR